MKRIFNYWIVLSLAVCCFASIGICESRYLSNQQIQTFYLQDTSGKTYDLKEMKDHSMIVLYFFDVQSAASQKGLLQIEKITAGFSDSGMVVLGITRSNNEMVSEFLAGMNPDFPILLDQSNVSELFQARQILPTIHVLGPGFVKLDMFQGTGKSTEVLLVRLAERNLQRNKPVLAKAFADSIPDADPVKVKASAVKGYAALKEGNVKQAEAIFTDLEKNGGEGELLGKEGLAAVYAQKGQDQKAIQLAEEVERKSPERSYANVIKGNLYYAQGKMEAAEGEFQKAIQKDVAEIYQSAVGYNQLGRFYANKHDFQKSRALYDQAIVLDPYFVEATSNKGMTWEKEGNWDKALESYRKALEIDNNDSFAAILAQKAEEMLALKNNAEKNKRIDKLVKELAARFREQKKSDENAEDSWTSRPMIMTFIDFEEKGGLAERDGFSAVLTTQLGNTLNKSGRVQVVERAVMERLLEELNLGSSELASQNTALRLGRVLASKIIGTGSLLHMPGGTLLNVRMIDTETSAIPKVITRQISSRQSIEKRFMP